MWLFDGNIMLMFSHKGFCGKHRAIIGSLLRVTLYALMQAEVTRFWPADPNVLQESTKASDIAHMIAAENSQPSQALLLPPVQPPLSKCHPANKCLFIRSRNKTQNPLFTLSNTPTNAATFSKKPPAVSFLFFFHNGGQRTSHPRSKRISLQTWHTSQPWYPSCECVCVCVICACRVWKSPL